MNRLVIIGNGFDMANGLKTSYKDFINWYWESRIDAFAGNTSKVSDDCLCKLTIKDDTHISCWNVFAFQNSYFKDIRGNKTCSGYELITELQNHPDTFSIDSTPFFGTILQSIETKGWVDIENNYYQLLKRCTENADYGYTVKELNEQLAFLQDKLIEYLRSIGTPQPKEELQKAMIAPLNPEDFSTEGRKKALEDIGLDIKSIAELRYNHEERNKLFPGRVMLLSLLATPLLMIIILLAIGKNENYIENHYDRE